MAAVGPAATRVSPPSEARRRVLKNIFALVIGLLRLFASSTLNALCDGCVVTRRTPTARPTAEASDGCADMIMGNRKKYGFFTNPFVNPGSLGLSRQPWQGLCPKRLTGPNPSADNADHGRRGLSRDACQPLDMVSVLPRWRFRSGGRSR